MKSRLEWRHSLNGESNLFRWDLEWRHYSVSARSSNTKASVLQFSKTCQHGHVVIITHPEGHPNLPKAHPQGLANQSDLTFLRLRKSFHLRIKWKITFEILLFFFFLSDAPVARCQKKLQLETWHILPGSPLFHSKINMITLKVGNISHQTHFPFSCLSLDIAYSHTSSPPHMLSHLVHTSPLSLPRTRVSHSFLKTVIRWLDVHDALTRRSPTCISPHT